MRNYRKYLRSKRWKKFKEAYFRVHDNAVCYCCHKDKPLSLHHRTYDRLGRERMNDVVPVCRGCHAGIHRLHYKNPTISLWEATDRYRRAKQPPKSTNKLRGKLRARK